MAQIDRKSKRYFLLSAFHPHNGYWRVSGQAIASKAAFVAEGPGTQMVCGSTSETISLPRTSRTVGLGCRSKRRGRSALVSVVDLVAICYHATTVSRWRQPQA